MFCPVPLNQPTLPGLPHVWHFNSVLFLHGNWDHQSPLTEHGPTSSLVKMIDCPSDNLATLHNIPVGHVVFPWSRSEKIRFKAQRFKIFSYRAFKLTSIFQFQSCCMCCLHFSQTHDWEWKIMSSPICSQSWTYLVKTYSENNLPEKNIGHKEAERKKRVWSVS